jgi:hypothetical protein
MRGVMLATGLALGVLIGAWSSLAPEQYFASVFLGVRAETPVQMSVEGHARRPVRH